MKRNENEMLLNKDLLNALVHKRFTKTELENLLNKVFNKHNLELINETEFELLDDEDFKYTLYFNCKGYDYYVDIWYLPMRVKNKFYITEVSVETMEYSAQK